MCAFLSGVSPARPSSTSTTTRASWRRTRTPTRARYLGQPPPQGPPAPGPPAPSLCPDGPPRLTRGPSLLLPPSSVHGRRCTPSASCAQCAGAPARSAHGLLDVPGATCHHPKAACPCPAPDLPSRLGLRRSLPAHPRCDTTPSTPAPSVVRFSGLAGPLPCPAGSPSVPFLPSFLGLGQTPPRAGRLLPADTRLWLCSILVFDLRGGGLRSQPAAELCPLPPCTGRHLQVPAREGRRFCQGRGQHHSGESLVGQEAGGHGARWAEPGGGEPRTWF